MNKARDMPLINWNPPMADNGGAVMVKAVAGGGGRGMRVVRTREELDVAQQNGLPFESSPRTQLQRSVLFVASPTMPTSRLQQSSSRWIQRWEN